VSDVDAKKLEGSLGDAFGPGQMRFCHDAKYPLQHSDRALCSFSDAPQQRCPALKQLCSSTAPPAESSGTRVPGWVSGLAELLFWTLMLAVLVGAGVALLRMRSTRRAGQVEQSERPSLEPVSTEQQAPTVAGDKDVQRLLDKARRAAERGELGVAIDAAHAAAVQGLAAAGHVELDRDRTNGDYLRDLREKPPLREQFRGIVGQVEVAQFGGQAPTRGSFDRVLDEVTALLRRIAVLSLVVLSAALLAGCGAEAESDDRSPHGLHAFRRLLSDQGAKVHQRVAPITKIGADVGLIVIYATALEEAERAAVLEFVHYGGSVVVVDSGELMDAGGVAPRGLACTAKAQRGRAIEAAPLELAVLGRATLTQKGQDEERVAQRVDVACEGHPYIVTAFVGDGQVTFIPERQLLTNASLSVADNARLVAELFHSPETTIELVGSWTGEGSQSPVQALKAAGMTPVVLQLLALALLIALRQGTSFGARRDPARYERRAFADHVRALASTYARAGAAELAASHYGSLLVDQMRERACPGQHPTLLQLASAVARRVGRPEPEIVKLLVEAKSAFDDAAAGGAGVNQKLIAELEKLSLQAGGIS
jgi:hypothetical protein